MEFCRRFKKLRCPLFWKEHISFYLDGTGFVYKTKPFDQAKAPSVREWRKKSEGLKITTKGKKEGCRNANFMVGIANNCGVVLCEQYFGTVTGNIFAGIVEKSFPEALAKCSSRVNRVLQDGCPRQNSTRAIEQNIMQETFEEFSLRVKKTMAEYPVEEIKRIIESMNGRVEKTLKSGVSGPSIEEIVFFFI